MCASVAPPPIAGPLTPVDHCEDAKGREPPIRASELPRPPELADIRNCTVEPAEPSESELPRPPETCTPPETASEVRFGPVASDGDYSRRRRRSGRDRGNHDMLKGATLQPVGIAADGDGEVQRARAIIDASRRRLLCGMHPVHADLSWHEGHC